MVWMALRHPRHSVYAQLRLLALARSSRTTSSLSVSSTAPPAPPPRIRMFVPFRPVSPVYFRDSHAIYSRIRPYGLFGFVSSIQVAGVHELARLLFYDFLKIYFFFPFPFFCLHLIDVVLFICCRICFAST